MNLEEQMQFLLNCVPLTEEAAKQICELVDGWERNPKTRLIVRMLLNV